jgi:hypothetical protein
MPSFGKNNILAIGFSNRLECKKLWKVNMLPKISKNDKTGALLSSPNEVTLGQNKIFLSEGFVLVYIHAQ